MSYMYTSKWDIIDTKRPWTLWRWRLTHPVVEFIKMRAGMSRIEVLRYHRFVRKDHFLNTEVWAWKILGPLPLWWHNSKEELRWKEAQFLFWYLDLMGYKRWDFHGVDIRVLRRAVWLGEKP